MENTDISMNEFVKSVFKDWAQKDTRHDKFYIKFLNDKTFVDKATILQAMEQDTKGWHQLSIVFITRYNHTIFNLKGSVSDGSKEGIMFQIIDYCMRMTFLWLYG